MSGTEDVDEVRHYKKPYSARNPIPTISKYREERETRQQEALKGSTDTHNAAENTAGDVSRPQQPGSVNEGNQESPEMNQQNGRDNAGDDAGVGSEEMQDTSQTDPAMHDPKSRRKDMKKNRKERAEREVTDPVTHLPVTIHDFTDEALKEVDMNDPPPGTTERTATGMDGKMKSEEHLTEEKKDIQDGHDAMADLFPPPDFDALRLELAAISKRGVTFGLVGVIAIVLGAFTVNKALRGGKDTTFTMDGTLWAVLIVSSATTLWLFIYAVREWMSKKIQDIFQDEVWDSQRRQITKASKNHKTESTVWLNSLIGSVWPLVNPDLFASLADTLEDVMQASLPKFIRMVSVDDIGQGSESLRILGVRWLPTGAATRAVSGDGKLMPADTGSSSDVGLAGSTKGKDEEKQDEDKGNMVGNTDTEGMEAEEGDFINLEIAFAYRTRSSSKSLRERTKDMHLYLAFYLPGNVKIPVWVDLQGMIGTMRMRLQLTPDPPFFALCTITFLGQPKVNLSCVPLSKHALNIMDVPFISKFVQSAVDAAMAQYVAPKSLTLDLKDMLAGDDFKKDTAAVGVLMVNIKRGYEFKMGDSGIPLVKDGSADPYVSVGWAKFGKVLWTTRILENEMEPVWDETYFMLVTPEELNIDERLRIQLWDSDRFTADDDLGRIEVGLKDLMRNKESNGQMSQRQDGFKALKSGDGMPGKLEWRVGYFSKTRIQQCQFDKQTHDPEVRSMEQLKKNVNESCERKLRETMFKEGNTERDQSELEQQKAQELKSEQDAIIISAPPPDSYPSGLFSLQIHNITGLELEKMSKTESNKETEASDEEETGEGMPSAYCTVIINHHKTFKTRTKPQNAKPFYNTGCERFIRDWRECEVYVSVRDSRIHEEDPLLGIVHLPLGELFAERSQVMGFWPLAGGIGHGRIRLSMVWRSVQLQAPRNLLGWQYGTVEVQPVITIPNCPQNLKSAKLKLRTNIGSGKMYPQQEGDMWSAKQGKSLTLAVQSRYNSCLSIALREKGLLGTDTAAFGVIWLKNLVDEEEMELEVPVWKGDIERATKCCLEECGEKIATIKLKLTFWSGLGSAHSRWASNDINLRNVVEVIDTARDNLQDDHLERKAGIVDESASSSSGSDSDSSEDNIPDGSPGNQQGPVDQARDYKKHDKGLHRRHRGIMQWKIPRTAKWVKGKFDKMEDNISQVFDHSSKQPGIETEV
ncbi:Fc.00g019550.m01.CDS01 [Cosmosporella sp. VM-42]